MQDDKLQAHVSFVINGTQCVGGVYQRPHDSKRTIHAKCTGLQRRGSLTYAEVLAISLRCMQKKKADFSTHRIWYVVFLFA